LVSGATSDGCVLAGGAADAGKSTEDTVAFAESLFVNLGIPGRGEIAQ